MDKHKEILEDKLKLLARDDLTLNAIKFVFEQRIEKMKPNIEQADDNKVIGEKYRAYNEATKIVDEVLLDIDARREGNKVADKTNRGK